MLESHYKRRHLGLLLVILLVAVNMLTYRGWAMSGDEVFVFDSAESFAHRGDTFRTYQFNQSVEAGYSIPYRESGAPWLDAVQEPFVSIVISPLVLIGQALPQVGTMHIVWLFNIFITALTAFSLYIIALSWGYKTTPSWLMALAFGIATNSVFYGRLLFRESLMALCVIWAFAFAVDIGRRLRAGEISRRSIILFIIAFISAFLTKAITILLLPAFIIVMLPSVAMFRRHQRRFIFGAGVFAFIIVVGALILEQGVLGGRYQPTTLFDLLASAQWNFVLESLLGFQVSLGRSFWLYSPPLILGLIGAVILVRRGEWRLVLAPMSALLLFSAWYGIALTVDWLGGWGWGPRYLVPLIPLFILWTLPVFAKLDAIWKRIAVAGIVLLGVGVQLLGMAIPLSNYYTDLFFNDKIYDFDLIYLDRAGVEANWSWMDAIWQWEWSPINYHLSRLDFSHLDIAWSVADPVWFMPITLSVLIGISIGWLLWLRRSETINRLISVVVISGLSIGLFVTIGLGLYSLRDDERYIGEWADVIELIDRLSPEVQANSVVFIDQAQYTQLFMNYFKSDALVATLPYAPAEVYDGVAPQMISDDPIEQLTFESVYTLDWTGDHYERVWLVASASPFETIKIRPIERYLVDHYYPIREISTSYRARAIEFLAVDAPQGEPNTLLDYAFDDQLHLTGMDLPLGNNFSAGEVVPLSLVWEVQQSLDVDYNIGIYLLNADGVLVAQQDGTPQATFGYTSQWQDNMSYRDNHGLQLATNLPAGTYQLSVAVYTVQDQQRLTVVDDTGLVGDAAPLGAITIEN